MTYTFIRAGTSRGPYTGAEIQRLLESGELAADDVLIEQPTQRMIAAGQLAGAPVASLAPGTYRGPLPPPFPRRVAKRGRRPVVVAVVVTLVLGCLVGVGVWAFMRVVEQIRTASKANTAPASLPLPDERRSHTPKWIKSDFEPDGPAPAPPESIARLVKYPSAAGELSAYVTVDPADGKKHPAVVWAHGGFGGIGTGFFDPDPPRSNDQTARAFREAGLVLMLPSWRGENNNPGRFELFYGEVDDLLAAVRYLKEIPYVDPERVYIAGHSTGGTLTLLASTCSREFRAAFSFGGAPDLWTVMSDGEGYGNTPYYPATSRIEARLRSAIFFTHFIARPVFYFEGKDSPYVSDARRMEARAREVGVPFRAFVLPGDHFDLLAPVTALIANKILADNEPECALAFTEAELKAAWQASKDQEITLTKVLEKWTAEGGDLVEALTTVEGDAVAASAGEIRLIGKAAGKAAENADFAALEAVLDLAPDPDDDESLAATFDRHVRPLVFEPLRRAIEDPPADSEAAANLLSLLATAATDDSASLELARTAIEKRLAADSDSWRAVFASFDPSGKQFASLMACVQSNPVPGISVHAARRANQASLAKWSGPHPLDSEAGCAVLRQLLESKDEASADDAFCAAVSLAFVSPAVRAPVLPLALQHSSGAVQIEAAWADLYSGGTAGLPILQQACLDPIRSRDACAYLREVGRDSDIPAAAREPAFAAKAEMINWLLHPNELGAPPESIEIYDTRELFWPPSAGKRTLFLFKFTSRTEDKVATHYGLTGGAMTWSQFVEYNAPPPPELLYIRHCALELSRRPGANDKHPRVSDEAAREQLEQGNEGQFAKP